MFVPQACASAPLEGPSLGAAIVHICYKGCKDATTTRGVYAWMIDAVNKECDKCWEGDVEPNCARHWGTDFLGGGRDWHGMHRQYCVSWLTCTATAMWEVTRTCMHPELLQPLLVRPEDVAGWLSATRRFNDCASHGTSTSTPCNERNSYLYPRMSACCCVWPLVRFSSIYDAWIATSALRDLSMRIQ